MTAPCEWGRIPAVFHANWMCAAIWVGSAAAWVPSCADEAPKDAASTAGPVPNHVLAAETAWANSTHVLLTLR